MLKGNFVMEHNKLMLKLSKIEKKTAIQSDEELINHINNILEKEKKTFVYAGYGLN